MWLGDNLRTDRIVAFPGILIQVTVIVQEEVKFQMDTTWPALTQEARTDQEIDFVLLYGRLCGRSWPASSF
jgi:hypothetical protein